MNYKQIIPSASLAVSITLHLSLFLLVGGVVLIQKITPALPPQSFDDHAAVSDVPPPPEIPADIDPSAGEVSDNEDPAPDAPSANPFDVTTITSSAPSPAFTVSVQTGVFTPGAGDVGGGGGGKGTGDRVASGLRKITMFSSNFEARKMGVLMDCSGSAGSFIMPTLLEIQKNFESAPIVLCGGGAMSAKIEHRDGKGTLVRTTAITRGGIDIDKVKKENIDLGKAVKENMDDNKNRPKIPSFQWILGRAAKNTKRQDLIDYVKNFVRRDDVWAVYLKEGGERKFTVGGLQYAFELLIKENVDTIYWFSDFADEVDVSITKELIAQLKEKNIKVIAHNFSGANINNPNLKSYPAVPELVKETGGMYIRVKPAPIDAPAGGK